MINIIISALMRTFSANRWIGHIPTNLHTHITRYLFNADDDDEKKTHTKAEKVSFSSYQITDCDDIYHLYRQLLCETSKPKKKHTNRCLLLSLLNIYIHERVQYGIVHTRSRYAWMPCARTHRARPRQRWRTSERERVREWDSKFSCFIILIFLLKAAHTISDRYTE